MNHDWTMVFSIASLVPQIKSFWKIVVHLNGSQLPFSTDNILDDEIDFRAIKRSLTLFFGPIDTEFRSC